MIPLLIEGKRKMKEAGHFTRYSSHFANCVLQTQLISKPGRAFSLNSKWQFRITEDFKNLTDCEINRMTQSVSTQKLQTMHGGIKYSK